ERHLLQVGSRARQVLLANGVGNARPEVALRLQLSWQPINRLFQALFCSLTHWFPPLHPASAGAAVYCDGIAPSPCLRRCLTARPLAPADNLQCRAGRRSNARVPACGGYRHRDHGDRARSEEHTSELQSRENLVCRLLLEKKKHERHTPTA